MPSPFKKDAEFYKRRQALQEKKDRVLASLNTALQYPIYIDLDTIENIVDQYTEIEKSPCYEIKILHYKLTEANKKGLNLSLNDKVFGLYRIAGMYCLNEKEKFSKISKTIYIPFIIQSDKQLVNVSEQ